MNLISRALKGETQVAPAVRILSLEEEAIIGSELQEIEQEIASDRADLERADGVSVALEDLAFVVDSIREATPREAALIQIAGDVTAAGSNIDGGAVTPSMEDGGSSAAERIRKIIETVVRMIKAFIKSAIDGLKSLLHKTEEIAVNYESRYQDLVKKVAETDFSKEGGKFSGSQTIEITQIPGYSNKELDQLPQFIKKYTENIVDFISVQGGSLRAAYAAILQYMQAKTDMERFTALKALEAASLATNKLGRHDKYAKPEAFTDKNVLQVRYGVSMTMLGGLQFGTSTIKYKIGDQSELTKSNRQLVVGADVCVVDVIRNVDNDLRVKVKVPTEPIIRRITGELGGLVDQIKNSMDGDTLVGAIKTRVDTHTRITDAILKQLESLDPENPHSAILADGVKRALAKLEVGSSQGYVVLINNTRRLINQITSLVNTSISGGQAKEE